MPRRFGWGKHAVEYHIVGFGFATAASQWIVPGLCAALGPVRAVAIAPPVSDGSAPPFWLHDALSQR